MIEHLKHEQRRLEEKKRYEAAKLEEELREAYRQEQLRLAAQRKREAASEAYQEELASQMCGSPQQLDEKEPLPAIIRNDDDCMSEVVVTEQLQVVLRPSDIIIPADNLTTHLRELAPSPLPQAAGEADALRGRSCNIDEEAYISRQIDAMRADLDNLDKEEARTKQAIDLLKTDFRESNVTCSQVLHSDTTIVGIGEGLLAGSSTPILLGFEQTEGSMSPLSSPSPAKSSPLKPRMGAGSPPTKQPFDEAPAQGFSMKDLISPVEVYDDSPEPFEPRVVIERLETLREETHRTGGSQPSSQAESANTFGFHIREVSCRSSERVMSPLKAPSE